MFRENETKFSSLAAISVFKTYAGFNVWYASTFCLKRVVNCVLIFFTCDMNENVNEPTIIISMARILGIAGSRSVGVYPNHTAELAVTTMDMSSR